jgi:NADH-quinone oxidoreductase subunit N
VNFSVDHILHSLWLGAPMEALILAGLAVLIADLILPREHRGALGFMAIAGMAIAFILHLFIGLPGDGATTPLLGAHSASLFMGALTQGYLAFLAQCVILGGGIFLGLISPAYIERREAPHGEYYALLLFAVMAMMALAASTELLTLFLNIELLSITLYILAGIEKHNLRSTEAAFKYFLLGSLAGAFLLMGIAFVYGATGELRYDRIAAVIAAKQVREPLFLAVGFVLAFVGFGFKLTLAPFHMYAPDVYEGAPTPVAAAIATISKVAVLAAFFPFVLLAARWGTMNLGTSAMPRGVFIALYAVCAVSMIVGNIGAVVQPNLKRMLAYSSIAHSGYAIVPMVTLLGGTYVNDFDALAVQARDAVAYYLLAYTIMTLLAFGVAASVGPAGETRIANYQGFARRNFGLAAMMALAMLSLLGAPPTVGFFGKLQLFSVAVKGGQIPLAVVGVLASVASAYYYLRVVVTMFMQEPAAEAGAAPQAAATIEGVNFLALGIGAVCLFLFAFVPALYLFGMPQ